MTCLSRQKARCAVRDIRKKVRVNSSARASSNDLHVKTTTERKRRLVHTYSEIPESISGMKAS
jgi:hypothetical protein